MTNFEALAVGVAQDIAQRLASPTPLDIDTQWNAEDLEILAGYMTECDLHRFTVSGYTFKLESNNQATYTKEVI